VIMEHPCETVETERPMTGAEILLMQLESSCLEVVLVPSKRFVNEGGCIRVAQQRNAKWYQQFCKNHSSDRRRKNLLHDTKIKRRNVIRALELMIAGLPAGKYEPELKKIAQRATL